MCDAGPVPRLDRHIVIAGCNVAVSDRPIAGRRGVDAVDIARSRGASILTPHPVKPLLCSTKTVKIRRVL
jgi:hypothetical protein